MSARKPEVPRISTAFLLSQTGARAAQEFARMLEPLRMTPADAGILRLLDQLPGISQQELARRLGMHASRLVALIDGLEERGLVTRETNRDDRRIHRLQLSDAGHEAMGRIAQVARAHDETMCAGLSEAERAQLKELLEKIAARHGLVAGVHPGYSWLGQARQQPCPPGPQRKGHRIQ